jgi:hypothetical protein
MTRAQRCNRKARSTSHTCTVTMWLVQILLAWLRLSGMVASRWFAAVEAQGGRNFWYGARLLRLRTHPVSQG